MKGKYCLNDYLYEKLKLVSTDFSFKNSKEYPLIQQRVDTMSALVRLTAKSIIN